MQLSRMSLILICGLGGACGVVGCHSASSEPAQPTTMPMPEANMKSSGPATMSVPPATQPSAAAPAMKGMTHVLAKDEPYFTSEPGAAATPSGTLKQGAKVLVLIPGTEYSKVVTDTGIDAYTVTDGLQPLGK